MASTVSGRIAFVTGGASGIGAALTTKLVNEGAEVWIADRQVGRAQELAQRLISGGGNAHAIELDVRSYSAFERAAAEAVQQSGQIDYLFNNAGIGVGGEVDSYTLIEGDAHGESASTTANTLGVSRATVCRVLADQADARR
jgi:NADP-dependent 3-hydroxy acid dehydrogenase YdfG